MLQLDGIGPLYRQIYRAFRNEILTRTLAPGERVPSTRALADLLKVSRNTAVLAYEQLLAEGTSRHVWARQEPSWRLLYRQIVTLIRLNRVTGKSTPSVVVTPDLRSWERES